VLAAAQSLCCRLSVVIRRELALPLSVITKRRGFQHRRQAEFRDGRAEVVGRSHRAEFGDRKSVA
jgi:hypothetical protein